MLIYQVKIIINAAVEEEWLKWMKTVHVPELIATGLLLRYDIKKPMDKEPNTYYFNYYFANSKDYATYSMYHAKRLREHPKEKFPNQFTAERTTFQWI